MARTANWNDDYWLLLVQLYLRRPAGLKPMYSRPVVDLALELHVEPRVLYDKMCALAALGTPRMERIWRDYAGNPRRLARAVRLLRQMRGFGSEGAFYDGVDVSETFERDFRPIPGTPGVTPLVLVLVLDLYFRLTPATMVAETPEVAALAKLVGLPVGAVVEAMAAFRHCDPYLRHPATEGPALLEACREVWRRHGGGDPEALASLAEQLGEYFRWKP